MAFRGIGPFASFLIIGPVCFFLGIIFATLPYDYYVLWADAPTTNPVIPTATYFDFHENHLKFLHASPPLISRMLHIVIAVGILGFLMKLYNPTEANKLFDGASLALYLCGIAVYSVNIVKGMRTATMGVYGDINLAEDPEKFKQETEGVEGQMIGREDSLRVIAASNTILAFILIGVLVLQAGEWYAERKEAEELEQMNKARDEKKSAAKTEKVGKKKQ